MHVVIIGNGAAAINSARAVLNVQPSAEITVFSEERYLYYPRPKLWDFLPGKLSLDELYFYPAAWYEERGIDVRLDQKVVAINPTDHAVTLQDGRTVRYDRLLLANGGFPFVPPIQNAQNAGVFTLRSIDDALAIRAYAEKARSALVIGGGLLGLESARGLRDLGLAVTVVELAPWLLPRQLDQAGADVLTHRFESMGIRTITEAVCDRIDGEDRAAGAHLKDGQYVPGDLVLISAGIRCNTTVASEAGLQVDRGVIVDEHMRTSAPDVYAAGDVCEFRGRCYGIIPAAIEQARVAGANLGGQHDAVYSGTIPSNTLKVAGIDLTSVGLISAPDSSYQEFRAADPDHGRYKKLVVKDNKLVGAILLGFPKEMPRIAGLIRQEAPLEVPVEELLHIG